MLRRRILASAMASVMAIGSVAVVASAEETAAATTQVKTKADLEALVKSYDSFRAKEINDYGSESGEDFLDALEYAENVVANSSATVDDYTVAYQMVEATYNALKVYTAEELVALIKANKAKYDSNNVYNEELGDIIYTTDSWEKFKDEYENAEAVSTSKDSRIITDSYETFKKAVDNLNIVKTVTKSQFRTALKTYEQLKQNVYKYDTWRRGELPGWTDIPSGNYWMYSVANNISFGALYGWATDNEGACYDAYDKLDAFKSVTKTSLEDIVNGYIQLGDINTILAAWTPDDTDRASKATVKSLINKYRGALVYNYNKTDAYALYDEVAALATLKDSNAKFPWTITKVDLADQKNYNSQWYSNSSNNITIKKMTDAAINVTPDKNVYIPVDKDGIWDQTHAVITDYKAKVSGVTYKLISKGSTADLTDFISVEEKVGTTAERVINLAAADGTTSGTDKTTAGDVARSDASALVEASKSATLTKYESKGGADIESNLASDAEKKAWKAYKEGYEAALKAFQTASADLNAALAAGKNSEAVDAAIAVKAAAAKLAGYTDSSTDKAPLKTYLNATGWNWGGTWPGAFVDEAAALVETAYDAVESASDVAMPGVRAENEEAETGAYTNADVKNSAKNQVVDYNDEEKADGSLAYPEYFQAGGDAIPGVVKIDNNTAHDVQNVPVNLAWAMSMAEMYIRGDKTEIASDSGLYKISTTGEIAKDTAKSSATEWTMVYRYLKYALSDKYDLTAGATYTKAQVVELLEKSYDLAEKTGDAALFTINHTALVDARKAASDWVAAANKDKKYKDNSSTPLDKTSTDIYKALDGAYQALLSDYNVFKYSFDEVYNSIASYSEMIDEGELEANDTLKAAMEETAYRLSIVESLDLDDYTPAIDDDAFTSDRYFQGFNRVYTSTDENNTYKLAVQGAKGAVDHIELVKANSTVASKAHFNLMKAYEALVAEVTKQTTPTVLLGDVNGDGVVNALDASAILKAVVNNTVIETAVGDYNADGAVNALDASAILKFVVSQA